VEPEGVPVLVGADDALYDVERQGQDVAQQHQEVLGLVLANPERRISVHVINVCCVGVTRCLDGGEAP
jgi:hypothetical protein